MNFTERVQKSIGQHFVSLSCIQHPPAAAMKVHIFSGFVVEIASEWFYVTAGHILRRVRTAIDAGSTFGVWRLGDQAAGNHFGNAAVPFAFELDHWLVLEDENQGLDYAATHLGPLYRRPLEAGGVVAIAKDAWSDHLAEHHYWVLAGIPSKSVVYDGKTEIKATMAFVPLTPTEPPPLAERAALNQFYARLDPDSEGFLADIDGMSGGPIVMLHYEDDGWKYSVIGIQSGWYPSSRIVAACPFISFAAALEPVVHEALDKFRAASSAGSV